MYVRLMLTVGSILIITGACTHASSSDVREQPVAQRTAVDAYDGPEEGVRFPSQLREYTLYEIERMLNGKDFSTATQAQLKMAKKLILEAPRLMEKGGDL